MFSIYKNNDLNTNIAALGLLLFFFFAWLGTAGAYLGLLILLSASVIDITSRKTKLLQQPIVILTLFLTTYITAHTIIFIFLTPELATRHIHIGTQWLSLCAFIFIAWWLARLDKWRNIFYFVVAIGLIAKLIKSTPWQTCSHILEGQRCGFGFQMILAALLLGTLLIGLLMFAPTIIGAIHGKVKKLFTTVFLVLLVTISIQMLIATQSRAVWLILALLTPPLILIRYWSHIKHHTNPRGLTIALISLFILIAGFSLVYSKNKTLINERMNSATINNVIAYLTFNIEKIDSNEASVSARAHLAHEGIKHWQDKPLFGWGAGIDQQTLMQAVFIKGTDKSHFHNTYIEAMVRFGLTGLILLLLVIGFTWRGLFTAYKNQKIDKGEFYFLNGTLVLLLAWSLADYQVWKTDWRFLFYIVMAFAASHSIKTELAPFESNHLQS